MDSFYPNATSLPQLTLPLSSYPLYALHTPSLIPHFPDRYLSVFAPFIIYWAVSLSFHWLDILQLPSIEKYKIHSAEEAEGKNRVTVKEVIKAVLVQQGIQTVLGLVWLEEDDMAKGAFRDHRGDLLRYSAVLSKVVHAVLGRNVGGQLWSAKGEGLTSWVYWWGVPVVQYLFAAFILDAWQYIFHRLFHTSKYLYKHIHSVHHRLYVPYAFGALYNHPVEGFVLDTLGAVIAESCARMTTRQAVGFFAFSTLKTVNDHSGYAFPWNPLELIFPNTNEYHDTHHQIAGLKYNFSQPYFIHFDVLFGTRMTREQYEAKRYKRKTPAQEVNGPVEIGDQPTSERRGKALKEE